MTTSVADECGETLIVETRDLRIETKPLPASSATRPDPQPQRHSLKKMVGREFERGMSWIRCTWAADALVLTLAIVSAFGDRFALSDSWKVVIAILAAFATLSRWVFLRNAKDRKQVADRARRAEILASCLGWKIPETELVNLLESFSTVKRVGEIAPYVTAERLPKRGSEVLCDKLKRRAQRAKFTYDKHAKVCSGCFVLSVAFLFALLYFVLAAKSNQVSDVVVRLLPIVLSADCVRSLLDCAITFRASSSEMALLEKHIGSKAHSDSEAMFVFGDYNAIVERTPLTLKSIYNPIKRRLTNSVK